MPTTMAGAIMAFTTILCYKYSFFTSEHAYMPLLQIMLIGCAIMMVSPFFLPKLKPRKNKLINFVQIFAIVTCYLFGFAQKFPEYISVLVSIYIIVGFTYGFIKREKILDEAKSQIQP
jgi:CDP-diacylglycerol---serine O-phosphatidyltransferase